MKQYRVWLETGVSWISFEALIELPDNLTEKEIDRACKDAVLEELNWGWEEEKEVAE